MGTWAYYLLYVLFVYAMNQPWLLVGLLVLLALQRFLPRPDALFRALRHARRLRAEVELNAANVTARRDLSRIYLDLRRPRAALALLEQALTRHPDDAELLYLAGLALSRSRRHQDALVRLVRALEIDRRVAFGQPYRVAGDALYALERWDHAIDAYERYLSTNGADVAAYTRLARAHHRAGEAQAASAVLAEAVHAFGALRGAQKRRAFGSYLKAQWTRASMFREPWAIVSVLGALVLVTLLSALVYRGASASFVTWDEYQKSLSDKPPSWIDSQLGGALESQLAAMKRTTELAAARCGTQDTGDFRGHYELLTEAEGVKQPEFGLQTQNFVHFEVRRDRIVTGMQREISYCLTRVLESSPSRLRAEVLLQMGVDVPGAEGSPIKPTLVILLERGADGRVSFSYYSDEPNLRVESPVWTFKRRG